MAACNSGRRLRCVRGGGNTPNRSQHLCGTSDDIQKQVLLLVRMLLDRRH